MLPLLWALGLWFAPLQAPDVNSTQNQSVQQSASTPKADQPSSKVKAISETTDLTADENSLFNLINENRAAQGLAPLKLDMGLVTVARAHSKDMCDRHYFDHYAPSPGPVSPMDRYLAYLGKRPNYAMVGENIYYRSMTDQPGDSAKQAENAFMNSPGHRENILQPKFTKVGVGFYRTQDGKYWVTQMFLCDGPLNDRK